MSITMEKPLKKSLTSQTPVRKKSLDAEEIQFNHDDFPFVIGMEIEKLIKNMPKFDTLQQQINYFNNQLSQMFGDMFNLKSILIKLFPFNNVSSISHLLSQSDELLPSGRPSFISNQEKEMIKEIAFVNFEKGNPLRISDLFSKVFSSIQSENFNFQYFSRYIHNNPLTFQIYQTETIDRQRSVISSSEISRYFRQIQSSIKGISPKLICNLDEIGFGDLQQSAGVHVVGKPHIHQKEVPKFPVPPSINRITAVVTVFLDGSSTFPFVIVPTSTIQKSAFQYLENCVEARIEHQENGYMDADLFQKYLERILIPSIVFRKSVFPELKDMKLLLFLMLVHHIMSICFTNMEFYRFFFHHIHHMFFNLVMHLSLHQ